MRNRWNVDKEPVIGWSARLHERSVPEVLRRAQEYGVLTVLEAPSLGYDRRAGSYPDFLAGAAMSDPLDAVASVRRVSSRVAHFLPDGVATEDEVTDLGAVLTAGPHARSSAHRPPLGLWADRVEGGVLLGVQSCSDIWLPWCSARFEEGAHDDDLADNRELACRHTPRLNAFLSTVADLARESGGGLAVEPDDTLNGLGFQVDDTGVRLEAEDPQERVVWQRFGRADGRDLGEALRAALASAERHPPPAPYRAAAGAWTTDVDHVLFRTSREIVRDALRDIDMGSLLDGSTRIIVLAGEVRHTFEPDELRS